MLRTALSVIVILILIFFFLVWSFDLTSPDQTDDSLIRMIKEAVIEVSGSFKELKTGAKTLKEEILPEPLNKEEINRLKEKVLQYEQEN